MKPIKMKTRTPAYLFTTISFDCSEIMELRRQVRITNLERQIRELRDGVRWPRQTVRVRPRIGKENPNAHHYRRGGKYWRWSSIDIRSEHGAHFDVYVHERICG